MKTLLTLLFSFFLTTGFAYEAFNSAWTETDPNNRLSQTATRSTWTALTQNEVAYLSKNAGVSYTGDFDIAFDFRMDSSSTATTIDIPSIVLADAGDGNEQYVLLSEQASGKTGIQIVDLELSGFTFDTDFDYTTLSIDTVYYARFRRDDDVGTNGTLYLDVYASEANRIAGTGALVSLVCPITVMGKIDLAICWCPYQYDADTTDTITGYLENLDLSAVPPAPPGSGYFGKSESTGSALSLTSTYAYATAFELTGFASITKLTAFLEKYSGTPNIKGLIFTNNSGTPGTLLGVTDAAVVAGAYQWQDLTFATPIDLNPGTYWLGVVCDTDLARGHWGSDTGFTTKQDNTYSYASPGNWGTTSYAEPNYSLSIYATYGEEEASIPSTVTAIINNGAFNHWTRP